MNKSVPKSEIAVAFRLVGAPMVRVAPHDWRPLPAGGAALVLAYVGLQGARSRAEIAEALWRGERGGENSARQAIHRLHTLLFDVAGREVKALVGRGTLALADGVDVDVSDGFAGAADRLELGELLTAVDVGRLPASGVHWLDAQRAAWRQRRARAFAEAAARLAALGGFNEAAERLQALVAIDPGRRELVLQLAQLHSQLGRPADGLALIARYRSVRAGAAQADAQLDALEHRLGQEQRAPSTLAVMPAPAASTTTFEGRKLVLDELLGAWAAGRAFVLVGEAGIGKTHLLERLHEGRPGAVLVKAQAGDSEIAYGTAVRWLRACRLRWPIDAQTNPELCRLLPELGRPPDGLPSEPALARALLGALTQAHERGLTALLFDDLQFADSASLAVLLQGIELIPTLRFGLATRPDTREPDTREPDDPFSSLTAGGGRMVHVPVPPLSLPDVHGFLLGFAAGHAFGRRASEVLRASTGNPWHVVDLVQRYFERGQPALAFDQLAAQPSRVDLLLPRLTAPARALLNLAVVAGPDYDAALADAVLATAADTFERAAAELAAAGLMQGQAPAHDIVAEHVLARLDEASRRGLHALIAAALAERAPPERLAHHHAGAEHWPDAARHAEAAARRSELLGERARQHGWLANAERWYRRAGLATPALRAGIDALEPFLYLHGSDAALHEAGRLAALATDAGEAAAIDVQRARMAVVRHDFDAALRHATAALPAAASAATRALATAVITIVRALQGGLPEALATIEPAMRAIEDQTDVRLRHELWSAYGIALANDERWQQIAAQWPAALADARRSHDRVYELDVLNSLAAGNAGLGRTEIAIELLRTVLAKRAEMDDNPESGRVVQLNLAVQWVAVGRYSDAVDTLQTLLTLAREAGADGRIYGPTAADALAEAWLALGRPDLAAAQVAEPAPEGHSGRRLARALLRARAASDSGAADAAALWHEVVALSERPDTSATRRERVRLMAIGPLLPLDEALCEPALGLARERGHVVLELLALLRQTQCRLRRGAADAGAHAQRLEELARTTQAIYLQRPEVLLTTSEAVAASGRLAAARRWRAEGREWLQRVAETHVPRPQRESFLARPLHRRLIDVTQT